MSWRPDLTVAALVERNGKFLFVEERVGPRMVFNQPAGHVERGEHLIDAVIRETLEETAWTFVPQALLGLYIWEAPDRQRSFLRIAFTGEVHSHDPHRRLDRGIARALWMSREELVARSQRLRSPMVLKCVDDFIAGARYSLGLLQQVASLTQSADLDARGASEFATPDPAGS
jgi:8-oxo-dGTP pyrophosphatase MutT (NUDIX family)